MAFDSLSDKLQNVFKKLRSKGVLTEDDVKEAMKEVSGRVNRFNNYRKTKFIHAFHGILFIIITYMLRAIETVSFQKISE